MELQGYLAVEDKLGRAREHHVVVLGPSHVEPAAVHHHIALARGKPHMGGSHGGGAGSGSASHGDARPALPDTGAQFVGARQLGKLYISALGEGWQMLAHSPHARHIDGGDVVDEDHTVGIAH